MTGPAGSPAGRPAGTAAGSTAGPATAPASAPAEASTQEASGRRRIGRRGAAAAGGRSADAPAGVSSGEGTAAGGRWWRRRTAPWWLVALLAAVSVAAAAAGLALLARPSQADLRDSALSAGRSYVERLTTFDARTLDEDVAAVERVSTEQFSAEYGETIAAVRDQVQADQTVSAGEVVAVGLEKLEDDRAVVLVAVNAEITSAGQPARTEANRVRVELVRQDGSWLLSGVDRL